MKQRSLKRDRVPKSILAAGVRAKALKTSIGSKKKPKLCTHGKRDALRQTYMRFYKKQKAKDREFGMQINALWKEFYYEKTHIQKSGKAPDKETVKYIAQLAKQIKDMTEQQRFGKEYPSFSTFYRFVRTEGVTLQDIKED